MKAYYYSAGCCKTFPALFYFVVFKLFLTRFFAVRN